MNAITAKNNVLQALRNVNRDRMLNGTSVWYLSIISGYPQATVRRTLGELKALGHNIVRDGKRVRLVA